MGSLTPVVIEPDSMNQEVREFLAEFLQRIDGDITNERAWEMARKFIGDGKKALELKGYEWKKLFGVEHGALVYEKILRFKYKYVDTQYGPSSDISIAFSSFFSSFVQGTLFSNKEHSQSIEVGTSSPLSTLSATVSPTSSPLQNRSMKTPHAPNISRLDLWDQTRKIGYQPLGMEAREQDSDYESRMRRPFHQDIE